MSLASGGLHPPPDPHIYSNILILSTISLYQRDHMCIHLQKHPIQHSHTCIIDLPQFTK